MSSSILKLKFAFMINDVNQLDELLTFSELTKHEVYSVIAWAEKTESIDRALAYLKGNPPDPNAAAEICIETIFARTVPRQELVFAIAKNHLLNFAHKSPKYDMSLAEMSEKLPLFPIALFEINKALEEALSFTSENRPVLLKKTVRKI